MSSSQILKRPVPVEDMIMFFESLQCKKQDDCYIFDKSSYNKGKLTNVISIFLEKCKPYYYSSKKHYVERQMTYNRFTTVLRQLCNAIHIPYSTTITYTNNSDYVTVYKIKIIDATV